MRSTGNVRKIDHIGRMAIPMELRRKLDIAEKDPLRIYTYGEEIVLKKYRPNCIFCGCESNIVNYKGKNICEYCITELQAY